MSGPPDKIVLVMRFELPREFQAAMRQHMNGNGGREQIRSQIEALVSSWVDDVMSDYHNAEAS